MRKEENGQLLVYKTSDEDINLEVDLNNNSVWFSLNQMAELLQKDKAVISKIYD